jgi:SWI/SNF-related matrix-associated actin-dependent regulator 1 of chromatin subfamily A
MKNYQRAGARFMATMRRAYNGDDMGLGKSLQTLAAFELTQAYPCVIVCPVKLKQNWLKEAQQWLPHRKAATTVNALAEITILGYSEIHDYVNYGLFSTKKKEREAAAKLTKKFFFPGIVKLKGIACDEGHFIKRKESRRSQACIGIARLCECDVRFVMSGTPIENAPLELVAPLEFLDRMGDMGGWFNFATRYCGATRNNFGLSLNGATNTKELNEKMRRLFYIRRLKGDVLKELPPKIQTIYEAEIDNEAEYRRIERDARAFLMQKKGELLTDGQMKAMAMVRIGMLRKAVGMGKVAWISEWVDTFLESGEKFILYAYHPEVQAAFMKNLARWNPASVLGGCKNPQAEVEKFQNDETCRLFIGSIVAAGFGLTLTRASHVGIAEPMWTQSKHDQTVDRAHRIGQKDCVNAYYFIAPGTNDEAMWEIVSNKAKIVAAVANGEDVPDDASLQNLVRKLLA